MTSLSGSAAHGGRAVRILFFAEIALSPLLAAIALLVPVAAHWGAYKYVPAIIWFVIFVQCLFTFRWRGLWFLLGPPVAFLAIEAFLLAAPPAPRKETPAAVIGRDSQKATRLGAADTTLGVVRDYS